jgi:6-pyruvoyl-tetrahydropterin synthase related domain
MSSNSSELQAGPSNRSFPFSTYLFEAGIVLLLVVATVVINLRMIRDGLNGNIDLKWHILWLQHFSKQLAEGIWYPRWLAGTNFGYGSPTFVFYPPLVYYIGSLLKFIGLNAEQAIITLFSSALFGSGLTFYIYGRNRWGKIAALMGSLAYMTAPYLGFIIYWVGSVSSIFAQPLIPLGWWLTEKAISKPKWRIALALLWGTLALTHLPSLLLCAIVWLPYTLFFLLNRSWKAVIPTIFSAGLGFGIVSFYLLPAILEQPFVNIDEMKKVGGGFQASMIGTAALPLIPLRFNLHIPQIFVHQSLAIIALTIIALICCRKQLEVIQKTWRWLAFAIALAFLMSFLSWPLWAASPTLQRIQAPWRLLNIFSLGGAALCSVVVSGILKLRLRLRVLPLLIISAILLINVSYSYKLSRQFPTLHNAGRANLEHLEDIRIALSDPYTDKLIDVGEYRPLVKGSPVPKPVIGQPRLSVVSGNASIQLNQWNSDDRIFNVKAEETSTIRIRTYSFPAWHLYVNKKAHRIDVADDGTMKITLEPGTYLVELRYQWTRYFTLGVILSIVSSMILFGWWLKLSKSLRMQKNCV